MKNMPEISHFDGIHIDMNWEDVEQHNKPHIHVEYSGCTASIGIDGSILAVGKRGFPAKQLKLISKWMNLHEDELYSSWNKAVQKLDPGHIKGLM
jgi:hypothetical protein